MCGRTNQKNILVIKAIMIDKYKRMFIFNNEGTAPAIAFPVEIINIQLQK